MLSAENDNLKDNIKDEKALKTIQELQDKLKEII